MRKMEQLQYDRQQRVMPAQVFIVLLLILVILIAGFLFVNSSFFTVGSVVIEGNKYIAVDEVYRIAGIPEPINIFRLNTTEIKNRLMRDLRIADVQVVRRFPGTIVVSLKERQPLAYVANSYGFLELDKQGIVLAVFKNLKQVSVPMITGIRLDNGYVGDKIDGLPLKNILTYLSLLDESALNQLSEVNIKSPDEVIAYTVNSIQIRLGNNERLEEKAKLTNDILQEVGNKNMAVEYVDLHYATPFIKFKH